MKLFTKLITIALTLVLAQCSGESGKKQSEQIKKETSPSASFNPVLDEIATSNTEAFGFAPGFRVGLWLTFQSENRQVITGGAIEVRSSEALCHATEGVYIIENINPGRVLPLGADAVAIQARNAETNAVIHAMIKTASIIKAEEQQLVFQSRKIRFGILSSLIIHTITNSYGTSSLCPVSVGIGTGV